MKHANHRRLAVLSVPVLLIATACGGDSGTGSESTSNDSTISVSNGDPQGSASGSPATTTGEPTQNTDATLIFFDAAGNTHLDPHEAANNSSLSQEQLWAVYDRLIGLTPEGDPEAMLASEWTYSDDLTELVLTLRDDVVFHDGAPFNAEAVVANFDRIRALGDQVGAAVKNGMAPIEGYEATGDYEVTIKLAEPNGQMPFWLSQQAGMMVSPAALASGAVGVELEPIGTGPFIVDEFISLDVGKYVRNDDYWGGTGGRPARFEHHYVTEGQARLNAVQSGQANLAIIDASQIPAAEAAGLEVQINPQTSLWNIYVNNGVDNITGNKLVRQAVMHAIDRQALVDNLSFGSGIVTEQLLPPGHAVYVEELANRYPFDPDRARELLAEAGHPDGVTIEWILLNTSEYRQIAEAIQAMLADVGIIVQFTIVDISEGTIFRDPENPKGDVMLARWGGRPDPLMTFQETTGPTGTYSPKGATASPLIGELIDQAMALAPENPERLEVLRALNTEVVEQAANFPIMVRSNVFAYHTDCISGLVPFLAAGDDNMVDVQVAEGCS